MGVKRIVDTDFWKDAKVIDYYSPEDKYFWLYILTNPQSRQVGIYKLPKRLMAFETGYDLETINKLLDKFQYEYKSIIYSEETQEVAILNYLKYSIIKGGKPVVDCIIKDISLISDKSLIGIVYNHIADIDDKRKTMIKIIEILSQYNTNDNDNENENENENNVTPIGERIVPRIVNEEEEEEERVVKKQTPTKKIYGEFSKVKLLEEEYNKLLEKLGKDISDDLIVRLDSYKASTGKTYKSDYATILNWSRKEGAGSGGNKSGTNSYDTKNEKSSIAERAGVTSL